MAKSNADYKREQRDRATRRGIKALSLPVSAGIQAQIDELCVRHEFEDWRELIFTMVRNAHSDCALSTQATRIPASGFAPTPAQLRAVSNYVVPDEDEEQ